MKLITLVAWAVPSLCLAQSDWTATSLHPSGYRHSYAYCITKGVIGGSANLPGDYLHSTLWTLPSFSFVDLTPLAVDGSWVSDAHGNTRVGENMTSPFEALMWTGNTGPATNLAAGGSGSARGVYGNEQVGDYYDSGYQKACKWFGTPGSFVSLHPLIVAQSRADDVFRGIEVGSALDSATLKWHACAWTGPNDSFQDLHPAGATDSAIKSIWDQGRVGYIRTGPNPLAYLWLGDAGTPYSLHPVGATYSGIIGTYAGIHVGSVSDPTRTYAAVWTGLSAEPEDLGLALPNGYINSGASDVWCDANTTYVVGEAYNTNASRYEAILWTRQSTSVSFFGQVQVPDIADPSTVGFTFEFVQDGETWATYSPIYPNSSGYFYVNGLLRGEFDVYVKGGTFLRKLVEDAIVSDLDPGAFYFALTNGDVDEDNEIGPGDFGRLSSAFGSVDGDTNWDLNADLDQDGEVGPSDFGILSSNFGLAGD